VTVNLDLALGAGMREFSRPVVVRPLASQPGDLTVVPPVPPGQPYAARGVWGSRPIDVPTEAGILSSQSQGLGIRALEFAIPVAPGDEIEIPAFMTFPAVGTLIVEDTDDDGQGGVFLTLKTIEP